MNFDLNIENYTRNELMEMFELPPNFDRNIIEIKETKLRDNIVNNNQLNKETKVQTLNFLTKAKNIILNEQKEPPKQNSVVEKLESFYNTSYQLKSSRLEDPSEHMIQIREDKPYLSSYPSEFFPGVINPIKKRTIRKNLNIDTRFRDNYYTSPPTNFNIQLPLNIDNVLQMQLSSIELPTSYYVVSKQYNNNYFTITVNDSTSVVTIPDGNYNQNTIMNIINTQLSLLGSPFDLVSFIINLVNVDTGSAQTMVGPNGTGVVTKIELNFQNDRVGIEDRGTPLPLKFGWTLGFRNGLYTGSLNYVSEGIVDLIGPRYLYLVVDDFNNNVNNNFYSAFNNSILNKNILARISLTSSLFNVLEQNNLNVITTPREYFGPVNLYSMNIQLLDEYGRIVDLNNMDYSFCLTLVTVYDI
jgi:hypothetical protein